MTPTNGRSPALPWAVAAVAVVGLATFGLTREEDDPPPPPPTTTTTFPRAAYVDAISAALTRESRVALGDDGSRCIASGMVDLVGPAAIEQLADDPTPLASLTPAQRDLLLRVVVTCVDPVVAEALLGQGSTSTRPAIDLPDEG